MSWACRTVTKFAALWEADSAEIDVQGCFFAEGGPRPIWVRAAIEPQMGVQ